MSVIGIAVSGCTTRLTTYGHASDAVRIPQGAAYTIPDTELSLEQVAMLSQCPDLADTVALEFEPSLKMTARQVRGPELYVHYPSLSSSLKISKIELETYANGVLKSVNVSVSDRAAETVSSVVKGVINVAVGAAGLGANAAAVGGTVQRTVCNAQMESVLSSIKSKKGELKALTARLTATTAEIDRLSVASVKAGLSDADKSRLVTLLKDSADDTRSIGDIKEAISKLGELSSIALTQVWRPTADENQTKVLSFGDSSVAAFVKRNFRVVDTDGKTVISERALTASEVQSVATQLRNLTELLVELRAAQPSVLAGAAVPQKQWEALSSLSTSTDGLLYRTPRDMRATVCKLFRNGVTTPFDECVTANSADVVLHQDLSVAQAGRAAILPMRNRSFQDNVLTAVFREDGSLMSFTYENKKAAAEAAAALFADVTGQGVGAIAKYRQAESDTLAARVARAEQQKKLETALKATPAPTELETVNANIALDQALLSQLKAEDALAAYRLEHPPK